MVIAQFMTHHEAFLRTPLHCIKLKHNICLEVLLITTSALFSPYCNVCVASQHNSGYSLKVVENSATCQFHWFNVRLDVITPNFPFKHK